jgi:alkanesulfonate monooxygenase SsuD/methylene tetrahydromethanopterin reductase-like flavin-dependent oxidoreductase (luciferase family)
VDFPPVRCFPKPAHKPHPPVLIGSFSSRHALKRVAEWGDGWIPVVSTVDQFAAGVTQVVALAKAAGRNPDGFDFTVFALEHQWRTTPEIKALQQAAANRVILWITRADLKSITDEIEELARKVLD